MKKILLMTILAVSLNAGNLWDMVKNQSSDGIINTRQYEIEVSGTNTRGYVFEVPEMKSICFVTYGSNGTPVMQCKTYKEMGIE